MKSSHFRAAHLRRSADQGGPNHGLPAPNARPVALLLPAVAPLARLVDGRFARPRSVRYAFSQVRARDEAARRKGMAPGVGHWPVDSCRRDWRRRAMQRATPVGRRNLAEWCEEIDRSCSRRCSTKRARWPMPSPQMGNVCTWSVASSAMPCVGVSARRSISTSRPMPFPTILSDSFATHGPRRCGYRGNVSGPLVRPSLDLTGRNGLSKSRHTDQTRTKGRRANQRWRYHEPDGRSLAARLHRKRHGD